MHRPLCCTDPTAKYWQCEVLIKSGECNQTTQTTAPYAQPPPGAEWLAACLGCWGRVWAQGVTPWGGLQAQACLSCRCSGGLRAWLPARHRAAAVGLLKTALHLQARHLDPLEHPQDLLKHLQMGSLPRWPTLPVLHWQRGLRSWECWSVAGSGRLGRPLDCQAGSLLAGHQCR